ncbi:MAG: hypothetical protein GXO85_07585 [Chlorobi bacterium]|nr:hypothetical protein [Chlorobiota bacterium]
MLQFIVIFLFFIVSLLIMWGALKFSNFEGESHDECEDVEDCAVKKLGIKGLKCDH